MNFHIKPKFWLFCTVLTTCLIGKCVHSSTLSSYFPSESTEEDNDCSKLNPKRTPVPGENQVNIIDLLNGGSEKMASFLNSTVYPENVILILGNTGCGKTTLTQILATNMSGLQAVLTEGGDLVIVDNEERIGAPVILSRTVVPELVTLSSGNGQETIYFFDCPGFDDNRGPEQDLATNYFLHQIVKNVKRVKMLFLVTSSSVTLGNDRLDFDLLATHATKFVRNLAPFENSIGLVVTKVRNRNDNGIVLTDKQILKGIVGFLLTYNQTLYDQLALKRDFDERETILRKIQFVQILLKVGGENLNELSHISFSRSPTECGPLDRSEMAIGTKARVSRMYQNLKYGLVGQANKNFGYTLKQSTITHIYNYVKLSDKNVKEIVGKTLKSFLKWFDREKLPENGDFGGIVMSIESSLEEINKFLGNSTDNLVQFGKGLKKTLETIGFSVSKDFMKVIRSQAEYYTFFESVIGSQITKGAAEWKSPFPEVLDTMETLIDWFKFLLNTKHKLVSYDLQKTNVPPPSLNRDKEIDWFEFLETRQITWVETYIKSMRLRFGPQNKHVRALGKVIQWALEPTAVTCENGQTASVTGNLVKLSDVLGSDGNLKGECEKAKDLVVLASNTVFLDANLDGLGKEMSVVVIAPKWQVIGTPHINLQGRNAENWPQPEKPTELGLNGINGKPGMPGGPGGVFLGIADKILMADRLTISVNGGNGGNGQNGADGAQGKEGARWEVEGGIEDDYGIFWREPSGYDADWGGTGGNGGNGGVGGYAGKSGKIDIHSSDRCKVTLIRHEGLPGFPGVGGEAGEGGIGGLKERCNPKTLLFFTWNEECNIFRLPNGARGLRGHDGSEHVGIEQARLARLAPDSRLLSYRFQELYGNATDKETVDFLHGLKTNAFDGVPCFS